MIDEHTLAFGQVDQNYQPAWRAVPAGQPASDTSSTSQFLQHVAVALACIDQLPYNYLQMLKRRNFELIPVQRGHTHKRLQRSIGSGIGKVVKSRRTSTSTTRCARWAWT